MRLVDAVEAAWDVDAYPPRGELLAQTDSPDGLADQSSALGDFGDHLRPRGQGGSDLDKRCGHPRRELCAVHHPQCVGNFVLTGQPGEIYEVEVAEQAVQDLPVGFQVE